jgi:hypothetical protein
MGWLTKLTSTNSKDPGTKNSRVFLLVQGNASRQHFKIANEGVLGDEKHFF